MQDQATNKLITIGYILAGLTNIVGILVVTSGFTNPLFHKLSPEVFNPFGSFMIMVWGLAYLAAASKASQLGTLALVFAFEKAIYVYTWIIWIYNKSDMLEMITSESTLVGTFYSSYGLIDLFFGLFFLWVGIRAFLRDQK
ncbi:MAG: hypothetical protein R3194_05825 [Limnobacter sp.]|nr:hypothetical protein [Limnobacter sp.]